MRRIVIVLYVIVSSAAIGLLSDCSLREGDVFAPVALVPLVLMNFFVPMVYTAWMVPVAVTAGLSTMLMQWQLLNSPDVIQRPSRAFAWSCVGLTPLYFWYLFHYTSFKTRALLVDGGLHVGWLVAIAVLAAANRRWPSAMLTCAFHGVLYGGLFYCAFPYLPWSRLGT